MKPTEQSTSVRWVLLSLAMLAKLSMSSQSKVCFISMNARKHYKMQLKLTKNLDTMCLCGTTSSQNG